MTQRNHLFALSALAVLTVATVLWWAFALWPLPTEGAAWLERARFICFNTTESGLPDASGWILLIGQPIGMLALLMVGWGPAVREALSHLTSSASGRLLATAITLVMVGGLGAAGVRVAGAAPPASTLPDVGQAPETYPRLERPWPGAMGLVDQTGSPFSLASLEGGPAVITFGFSHCETICPMVVANALAVADALSGEVDVKVVTLTLDPWRDTPSRLPDIAEQWGMGPDDLVLSGSVADVEAALNAWGVQRVRNTSNGDISHPPLAFLVESDGTVAYASTGNREQLTALARRLRPASGVAELRAIAVQLDSLEVAVRSDDEWLGRNARVMEGYGQHQEYAHRLALRGRRAASHTALLTRYTALRQDLVGTDSLDGPGTLPPRSPLPTTPARR